MSAGAASFKRWLGCAPQVIARFHPCTSTVGALTGTVLVTAALMPTRSPLGSFLVTNPIREGTMAGLGDVGFATTYPDGCVRLSRSRPEEVLNNRLLQVLDCAA